MADSPGRTPQQTVKLAIDSETGDLVTAESLLSLDEAAFSALRRQAMAERRTRKRLEGDTARLRCAICRHPLYLSRHRTGAQNRWFVHDGTVEHCPWNEKGRLSPDQTKALIYRGQQEGAKHRELKRFLADWLSKDPLVSAINLEQTTFSEVVRGEWRRPDVKCLYNGKPLVIEIQLSYLFLSDVIARDEFYQREGIYIIWLFALFDRNRAAVTDEAFFNRRNLFVLDGDAIKTTKEKGRLTFSGYHQVPQVAGDKILDTWTSQPVELKDVNFPSNRLRPYFFDYDSALANAKKELSDALREQENTAWGLAIDAYLNAATRYYESNFTEEYRKALTDAASKLTEHAHWHRGFEPLIESSYTWHRVLCVLLSIRLGSPLGYNVKSVYQVLEIGLRIGHRMGGKHCFAILFLWAYKKYKPAMSEKHRQWLKNYAEELKESVDGGEAKFARYTGYDEAIGLLFPELEEYLVQPFGCTAAS